MKNFDFVRYDKVKVTYNNKTFYDSLAEELGVPRRTAKLAFWYVVYRAGDFRLGALLQDVDTNDISAEDSVAYEWSGDFARPIITHYIIERYRVLDRLNQINYEIPVDIEI